MGSITESFGNLTEYLLLHKKNSKARNAGTDLILNHLVKPYMPSAVRCGTGTLSDIKDRQSGPFDVIVSQDTFPPLSEGSAATFLSDGVLFILQVRNWAEQDLTHFGEAAHLVKKLEGKRQAPIPCLAVSFEPLALAEVTQFLNSKAGQAVDGVLSIGDHVILRNSQGWYGNPEQVPFVTERPGPEALKSFTFFLMHLAHSALGVPFGMASYQHL